LITALFVLVSLSTLVVAAVNVAHTFFRAIAERRHELGVMRAVGATEGDIKTLLLGEAVAVGVLGGVLGVLLAYLVGLGIDLLSRKVLPDFPFKPESYFWFSPGLVALLLGFSVLVCLLGALWPARTAAKLSPAQSLSGR
jgi:ABC-type antimicrobial peptide transport system permease subunit